jgi:hypothetical protein
MTGRYTGDCCPACGSHQVIPYAVVVGATEEYGYQCQVCEVTWPVMIYAGTDHLTRQAKSKALRHDQPGAGPHPRVHQYRHGGESEHRGGA